MSQKNYTCFFISPIGQKDSDVRKNSDRVMRRILLPALAQCGINRESVLRSDMDPQPGQITHQMMEHLNGKDVCIADLTGLNPNVMFEIGYRKGLGKAVILLSDKSTFSSLPFDVTGERVIQYNMDDLDVIDSAVVELEQQVRQLVESGSLDCERVVNEEAIFTRLKSIERKLEQVLSQPVPAEVDIGSDMKELELEKDHPVEAFNYYATKGEIEKAERVAKRLKKVLTYEDWVVRVYSTLLTECSNWAAMCFKSEWDRIKNLPDFETKLMAFGSFISYCAKTNNEPEEYEFAFKELEMIKHESHSAKEKIQLLNQQNRLAFGAYMTLLNRGEEANQYQQTALSCINEAIELNREHTEPALWFNRATILFQKGSVDEAKQDIEFCLANEKEVDFDHYRLAYAIYQKSGDSEKSKEVDQKLLSINRLLWTAMKSAL